METLIFLISNAFLAYIIWRFAYKLFLHYDSIRPALYMTICYYLLNSFCTIVLNNPTINLLSSLIGLSLITIPCKDRLIKKIFFIILVTSIGFVWDVLMYAFINRPDSLNAVRIIANLSLFVVEIIFETIFSHLKNSAIEKKEWYMLCIVPVGTIIMLYALYINDNASMGLYVICSGIGMLTNIIIFQFYDNLCEYYNSLLKTQQAQSQLKLYEEQIRYMETSEKKMNAFRHDLNNHFAAIQSMAKANKNQELLNFLEQFHISFPKDDLIQYTRNKDFNLLLNYLIGKAQAEQITPEIDVDIPITLNCNMYDMNVLLSNLFDNAIEAASATTNRIFSFHIKYAKEIMYIEISNSYVGKIWKKCKDYQTTKSDKKLHGYGLKNVKYIVTKYHGTINTKTENHIFFVSIYLFMTPIELLTPKAVQDSIT